MMKKYKWSLLLGSLLSLSPILIGLLLWNQLPAKLPTHFSTGNTPDGWSSKAITVFGLPLFMFAMMWFCFLFTHVDPKRQNISPKLIRALVWFMAALSPIVVCSSYAIALGINVNITLLTYLIIGLMLLVIGNYLAKTKQNYSAGIRIPWTLSSEENWNRTHRVSSRLFIFCGLAMIANGFLDSKILLFFIMAVLIVIPYAYSFLAQKIRRKFEGSPTFVILTDREELNSQISDTFENCGLLGKNKSAQFIATSGEDLVQKLKGNPSFIFTLIQKFNKPNAEPIYPDHDIIIMSDEAHRSQYGIFADNMMKLLPTAARMGFTGTPLLSSDNITARTFGGYVSVYDFKRAVEDGATVPLYYENRGEKILDLHNPEITEQILDAIENADLDVDQQDKLEAEFAKEIHLMTAEPRLKSIARDFVNHYSDLWTSGKAMFVCLNKVTCVRMYNYVQEYWKEEIKQLKAKIKTATQQEAQELERKLKWMQETEMAVVISQEQNEIQTFKKWNLDIKYHRTKMEKRELDKEFKNSKNPLRVVFVCAMWLTGFDVKCLSCLYLDKPLKAHTLMQTIARANRVSEGKSNGLIVDYIGIVKALRKALADYTANVGGNGGTDPTVDKEKLIARIIETIEKAKSFLADNDFDLQMLIDAYDFQKLSYLQEAANAVCGTIEDKKTFTTYASELNRLMKYTDRDDITGHTRKEYEAIAAIYAELQKKRKHINTTDLMVEINAIISSYVEIQHMPSMVREEPRRFDISAIDFDLLRREFAKVKKKNLVLKDLEEVIQQKLDRMMFCNPDRINYYERYQQIIDDYNSEQDRATIEKTFMDLMDLANQMNQEEQRYVREGFSSDEELSFYDMLFRDDLSKNDIKKLKEVAADLLHKIKDKISELDHWTDKQETKAAVDNLIRDTLWAELPECYDEVSISGYRQKIYEYVYTRYKEVA